MTADESTLRKKGASAAQGSTGETKLEQLPETSVQHQSDRSQIHTPPLHGSPRKTSMPASGEKVAPAAQRSTSETMPEQSPETVHYQSDYQSDGSQTRASSLRRSPRKLSWYHSPWSPDDNVQDALFDRNTCNVSQQNLAVSASGSRAKTASQVSRTLNGNLSSEGNGKVVYIF